MFIAREGFREIAIATVVLTPAAWLLARLWWPLSIVPVVLWLYVLSFFRDPPRRRTHQPGELCSPADGTVQDVTLLETHETIGGPAARIGIFLSLFNVHVNRMPCAGRVRGVTYRPGRFLDARDPRAGTDNESNTLVIEPDPPMPGPVEIRQVAGLVARRIVCHAAAGQHWEVGARFGLIKFGSRTELIIPRGPETEIRVKVGDRVFGGLTIVAAQKMRS